MIEKFSAVDYVEAVRPEEPAETSRIDQHRMIGWERRLSRRSGIRLAEHPAVEPNVKPEGREFRDQRVERPEARRRDEDQAPGPRQRAEIAQRCLRLLHVLQDVVADDEVECRVVRTKIANIALDVSNPLVGFDKSVTFQIDDRGPRLGEPL